MTSPLIAVIQGRARFSIKWVSIKWIRGLFYLLGVRLGHVGGYIMVAVDRAMPIRARMVFMQTATRWSDWPAASVAVS